jgi:hypothetical protein
MDIVKSKNSVPIRLTAERWLHITDEHSEMAGYYFDVLDTIQNPEVIYTGKSGELMEMKEIEIGKYIIVVYKELNENDGFIITSFLTRKTKQIERRVKLWP